MTASSRPMVLLDVGSTNSRAWLARDGEIVASRTAPVGVRDSAREGSTAIVRSAVRDLIAALAPRNEPFGVAAAGMITSPLGLAEVAHVAAPASAGDLAAAAVALTDTAISPVPVVLVPGVRTPGTGADLRDDVMRGEETLVLGLVADGVMSPGGLLLNAGSHWKLIAVDGEGRIAHSRTSLGGEVVHAVQSATLLTASLPPGPLTAAAPEWLEAGADAAARDGLLRALFGVRLLDQRGGSTAEQRFAWMAGACISEDLRALFRGGELRPGARVLVSGPAGIPGAWAHLLRREGCEPRVLTPDVFERAFVTGLLRIVGLREEACGMAEEESGS
jgi:2-dehydro-3-deoxygalactonokinase